jgi:hypothetical protein
VSVVHVLERCAYGLKGPQNFYYMVRKKISDEILSAHLRIWIFADKHGSFLVPAS